MAQPRIIIEGDSRQSGEHHVPAGDGGPRAPNSTGSRPSLAVRLLRVVASFGVVVSAYAAYALAVVPLIEPSVEKIEGPGAAVDPPPPPRTDALVPFFPPDAWELKNPKILESERAMLLIKSYQNLPDGRVKLHAVHGRVFRQRLDAR